MPPGQKPGLFMTDEQRAGSARPSARSPTASYPEEIDHEETPRPTDMNEFLDKMWSLRNVRREIDERRDEDIAELESQRRHDHDLILEVSAEVAIVKVKIDGVTKFGDALDELDDLSRKQERDRNHNAQQLTDMRREIWGDLARQPNDPPLATAARSGKRMLGWLIAIATALAAAGGGGVLVAVRRAGESEGEVRQWRTQVTQDLQFLFRAVFHVDMQGSTPSVPKEP